MNYSISCGKTENLRKQWRFVRLGFGVILADCTPGPNLIPNRCQLRERSAGKRPRICAQVLFIGPKAFRKYTCQIFQRYSLIDMPQFWMQVIRSFYIPQVY
jgi:hypothetical protein